MSVFSQVVDSKSEVKGEQAEAKKGKRGRKEKAEKAEGRAADSTRAESFAADMADFGIAGGQDGNDDDYGDNYVPALTLTAKDVFANNSNYTFSIAYFKARGYDNRYQTVSLNGFDINSLVTGRPQYSQWGGLNHIFRYPETSIGINPCNFTFGDAGGCTNYNLRAGSFKRQLRATYSLASRTYSNRLMVTGSTGVMNNGWSVAGSLSSRFGNNLAYVEGTTYTGFSGFLAAEKQLDASNWLNLSVVAAMTKRGMQANAVQEAYDLLGNNYYNANWGLQNGRVRNARVRTTIEPVIMLTHTYAPKGNKMFWQTNVVATFGRNNTTAMNWYDVPDPRPDYYRYLPSYQINAKGDTSLAYHSILDAWKYNDLSVTQINWDNMYNVNRLAKEQGLRAQYMIENRIFDHVQFGGNSNLLVTFGEHTKMTAGVTARGMKQKNYKTIGDLLGGAFWLDVDKFSEGDFPDDQNVQYNDLLHKDDTLHEGDIFGYHYDYHIYNERLWAMFQFNYPHLDFHVGGQLGCTQLWRYGLMQNGRFQDESSGKSSTRNFVEGAAKAGLTWKINGRNYLALNGFAEAKAPGVLNAFVAPRIRNKFVDNLKDEKIYAADFSYVLRFPAIKLRATAYFTQITDATRLISFYHDDFASMVNYSISGIDQRHLGMELGAEVSLGGMFTLFFAGNFGDYRYSDRAHVTMNAENGSDFEGSVDRTVYWKNFHVAGTPQNALTTGLKFNHDYWWVTVNANYFDKIYCDLNPERRTTDARGSLDENSALYHAIADQTRLKGQFTMDLSVSKSWRIDYKYNIGFNLSVTNILNNRNLVTTAWEQYRFDYKDYNAEKFGNKYYYALGTTFFLGLNFSF